MPKKSQRERVRAKVAEYVRTEQTVVIERCSDRKRRAKLERDNEAWIWEMFGPKSGLLAPLSRPFTSQDSEMIGKFFDALQYGGDSLTLASRGQGKTSRLRECITKALLTGVLTYGVYLGATKGHADDSLESIKDAIAKSASIKALYPEVADPVRAVGAAPQRAKGMLATGCEHANWHNKFEQVSIEFQWSSDGILLPRVPGSPSFAGMFRTFGLDSPVRGLNWLGRRPDGAFIDDADTPNTVSNPEQAQKVIDRIHMDIGGLRGEAQKMCRMILATLSHKGAGVAYMLSGEGSPFVATTHKYLIEKPHRMDLWMDYVRLRQKCKSEGDMYGRAAHKFYLKNCDDMDAGARVSNEHRFTATRLPDGSQQQVSALQNYFDEWADKGEKFCQCELDNERVENEAVVRSKITAYHVSHHARGDLDRQEVLPGTNLIVRGMDIRKTALHHSAIASGREHDGHIVDYNVHHLHTEETSVEQAEDAILAGMRSWLTETHANPFTAIEGEEVASDLTLIDKGWKHKSWATQPVETFCMEQGLRRFLPAKGAPNYRSPKPSENTIIGDNWHMNRGEGKDRRCTEVIFNSDHWKLKVHERFMLPRDSKECLTLFRPASTAPWDEHTRYGQHITAEVWEEVFIPGHRGVTQRWNVNSKRNHWLDAAALMLVAQSVEGWFRTHLPAKPKRASKPRRPVRRGQHEEIGAR